MRTRELEGVERRLGEFLEELTACMGRKERRHWAEVYVRGLLLDGHRKSMVPLAQKAAAKHKGDAGQALQGFISESNWSSQALMALLASRLEAQLGSSSRFWIIDETSFPKQGSHSVGVAHQYCGALGKQANCQVAVSLHVSLADGARSQPVGWRLFLPETWINDPVRRQKASIPESLAFSKKPQLALDLIDEALNRAMLPGVVLADEVYGVGFQWRAELRARGLSYCVQVGPESVAWLKAPLFQVPAPVRKGGQQPRCPRLAGDRPQSLTAIAMALPESAWKEVCWRQGSRGAMCSRFAQIPVWAAHGWQHHPQPERVRETLLVEWPAEMPAPTKYWLAHGLEELELPELVNVAKGRWRIEQDYRELKDELGLDHFEGRSFPGWEHHVTLVTMAFAFLREEQQRKGRSKKKTFLYQRSPSRATCFRPLSSASQADALTASRASSTPPDPTK